MKARLEHLSGDRAGESTVIWKSYATLGRNAQADIRFGPDGDLMVASRHAAVVWRDGNWWVRDLGSLNGTFVDGSRVNGEAALRDGSVVQLGRDGPKLGFGVIWEEGAPEPVRTVDVSADDDPDALTAMPTTPVILSRPPKPFVEPALTRSGSRRWPTIALALLAMGTLAGLALTRARTTHTAGSLRSDLLARADSVFSTLQAIGDRSRYLGGALSDAQSRTARLRLQLRRAADEPGALAPLRGSLEALEVEQRRLVEASSIDVAGLLGSHQRALALAEATYSDGRRVRAGAVAVSREGGRTVYVTSREALADSGSSRLQAVRLHGGGGVVVARVLARRPHPDLLLLEASVPPGAEPLPMAGAADRALVPGEPALLLGFSPGADSGTSLATSAAVAIVESVQSDGMRLQVMGTALAPGSAVVDRRGSVVGLVVPSPARATPPVRALPVSAMAGVEREDAGAS
ncbi:MAG: FHA domain-containing protein [Gemmatimonadales bacterium]|jgi:pSer/pThr/pTyr-binding forkhead associated (FHA) protein|nr:FHA domain-containing protein [Gemmatimonadales bacterium]